jgi:hypothetical protein
MALTILKQEQIAVPGGGNFDVKYDPTNGDVVIVRAGISGDIFFKDGDWTQSAEDVTQAEKDRVYANVQSAVRNAYKTLGGPNKNYVLPPWADISKQQPITAATPTNPIANALNLGGIQSAIDDIINLAKIDPKEFEKLLKFGEVDQSTIKGTKEKYPIDAVYGKGGQDYIIIDQYKYTPPRQKVLFSDNPKDILLNGSQRGAAFKKEDYIGFVKLPMPNEINDSNNVSWGEDAMNNLSAALTSQVLQNPTGTGIAGLIGSAASGVTGIPGLGGAAVLGSILKGLGVDPASIKGTNAQALVGSTVASRILAMAQLNVSPESILARGFGVAPNSNMELLFNSPTLREFQFNWKMSPRSEPEAVTIRKIIRFFKQGMAAKKLNGTAGGASYFLGTPNIFQIQYKTTNDADIPGLNRIKTCALTGTSVNYTPDGEWASYADGQPVSTVLTLRFQELEPIYDTDYQENIADGRIDLYPIRKDEVGY